MFSMLHRWIRARCRHIFRIGAKSSSPASRVRGRSVAQHGGADDGEVDFLAESVHHERK